MSISDVELEQLREGTWQIHCPQLRLLRCSKSEPLSLSGVGAIRQDSECRLLLTLYTARSKGLERWNAEGWKDWNRPAGRLIPEDAYYDLDAVDEKGRKWRVRRFRPNTLQTAVGRLVIESELQAIQNLGSSRHTRDDAYLLQLHIFANRDFPANSITKQRISIADGTRVRRGWKRDAWRFRACESQFLLFPHSTGHLELETRRDALPPAYFRERVAEALQFVLGSPVRWVVALERRGDRLLTEIRSRTPLMPNVRYGPPLPARVVEDHRKPGRMTARYHQELFRRFLGYTLTSEKLRHPLWGDLNALYEASGARFINAQALTLTAVIEAILGREKVLSSGKLPAKRTREAVLRAQHLLEVEFAQEPALASRLKGAVGQLLKRSPADSLRELEARGAVTAEQWKAWRKLRNIATHEYQHEALSSDELRHLLRVNEVLFFHLVFHAIGYKGPYLDYSQEGWPLLMYPNGAQ